jgi:monovalent cation/proton antiporter MnhG/PhaG subunit
MSEVVDVVQVTLVAVGVLVQLISCLGLLVVRDVFDRLHFLSAAGAIGPAAVAAAVFLEHGLSTFGVKALLITLMIGVTGPVMTHAIAKMARVRREGGLRAGGGARR